MEMRHLNQFIALAEEKQFTAAARRVNVVQSGLSVTIKELEKELGIQLVERSTRRVSLTRAGEEFLAYARTTLATLNEGVQSVRAHAGVVRGKLNIGVLQSLYPYVNLPALLRTFDKRYPDVEFTIRALNSERVPDLVRSGSIDIGFQPILGTTTWPGVELRPFIEDSLVAISAIDGPLAGMKRATLNQLSKEIFLDLVPERALRALVDHIFVSNQLRREIRCEIGEVQALLEFVGAGLGIALVPAALTRAASLSKKLHVVRLVATERILPLWKVALILRKQRQQIPANAPLRLFLTSLEAARRRSYGQICADGTLASGNKASISVPLSRRSMICRKR